MIYVLCPDDVTAIRVAGTPSTVELRGIDPVHLSCRPCPEPRIVASITDQFGSDR